MQQQLAAIAFVFSVLAPEIAAAHTMPWRAGESRVKGYGSCAKGPCMKRADFSASRPHRHVGPGKCGIADLKGRRLYSPPACNR